MPLLDHFHPPVYPRRSWESFHATWANSIRGNLHQLLPPRYFAEVHVQLGSQVEADVVDFESTIEAEGEAGDGPTAVMAWTPPVATWSAPMKVPDQFEVHILDERDDSRVVAVIELVSPRNKDRQPSRAAFAAKCAAYLSRDLGLIILDIVTSRSANLHNHLMTLMEAGGEFMMSDDETLYAVSYQPVHRERETLVDIWPNALQVGERLPQVPLSLRGGGAIPLDLEASHQDACQRSRL